ncbi:UNVERIFIED_CONTAM: hypothetical protein HDU68_007965 [Siphonaria sp. JEL0065]|nr:hypothetical protein HDU68_007965 [Siphonaria sp. JEL0065]
MFTHMPPLVLHTTMGDRSNFPVLVNKCDASGYVNGHHIHHMAYYQTNNGKSLQIQVESGGNEDAVCAPCGTVAGNETAEFGFAHAGTSPNFGFITQNNTVVFTASVAQFMGSLLILHA